MRMALKDGQVMIIEADPAQFTMIKSWNLMKWDVKRLMFTGRADRTLLNKLHDLTQGRLPEAVEAERSRLNDLQATIDWVRTKDHVESPVGFPVTKDLFDHQKRGALMALLAFGIVRPCELRKEEHGKEE